MFRSTVSLSAFTVLSLVVLCPAGCAEPQCPEGTYKVRKICRRVDAGIESTTTDDGGSAENREGNDEGNEEDDVDSSDPAASRSSHGADASNGDNLDASVATSIDARSTADATPGSRPECGPGQYIASAEGVAGPACAGCASGSFSTDSTLRSAPPGRAVLQAVM